MLISLVIFIHLFTLLPIKLLMENIFKYEAKMNKLILVLLLFVFALFAQDYINVETTGITRDALLDDISKITFSADGYIIK